MQSKRLPKRLAIVAAVFALASGLSWQTAFAAGPGCPQECYKLCYQQLHPGDIEAAADCYDRCLGGQCNIWP